MPLKLTTEKFIERARKVHGDQYDYSKVVYINKTTKITIICPEHGEFTQTPQVHRGGSGCRECGKRSKQEKRKLFDATRREANRSKLTAKFKADAWAKHGDQYDYSRVEYTNNKTNVVIGCTEHGDFEQTPSNHLNSQGCPVCGVLTRTRGRTRTQADCIERFHAAHGDRYDYSQFVYVNSRTNGTIICKEHVNRP